MAPGTAKQVAGYTGPVSKACIVLYKIFSTSTFERNAASSGRCSRSSHPSSDDTATAGQKASDDGNAILDAAIIHLMAEAFALAMGLANYVELILWFHAVRHIDVSVASSVTVPAPAVTLLLSMAFLGTTVEAYQLTALTGD